MKIQSTIYILLGLVLYVRGQENENSLFDSTSPVSEVRIFCNSDSIVLSMAVDKQFNGMVYPKGLSKNSTCMVNYSEQRTPVLYKLPLKSCNTMSAELTDGIEYFNTVVVQPHRKLVTNQGRGYHVRCKYQTQEKTVTNIFNVTGDFEISAKDENGTSVVLGTTPLTATAPMPGCHMRIFYGEPSSQRVAESVKIGDLLTMVIELDDSQIYGMKVTNCIVRDGLSWNNHTLIDDEGCPVDTAIFGTFEYSKSKTIAVVRFQAHKFPYTDSVYYQCNVQLCVKNAGGCDDVPPNCPNNQEINFVRRKRATKTNETEDLTIEVFTGLYVNEEEEAAAAAKRPVSTASLAPTRESTSGSDPNTWCLSPRTFALGIAIAGLILMIAVIAAILILIKRRLRRKDHSTTGSSIYSGPYTNTAYSHSS